jgi:pyruvate/2-oxoglutarate dehydrogenase complex dihydrolipoamide acyltransferase (E2) component
MSKEPMSLRAYARHRGVSLRAVQKAIASGRISTQADGRLDAASADANWASNTAPRPIPAAKPPAKRPVIVSTPEGAHHHAEPRPAVRESSEPPKLESGLEYSKARAYKESFLARIAKMDYEERAGKLVSRDEMKVAAFNRYRTFRDGMLNIPDRLAAVLAAETDPRRTHELLSTEIRKALTEFSDGNRANG